QRQAALTGNQLGALWAMIAASGFTLNGALVRDLALDGVHPFQISLARAGFAFLAVLPFLYRLGFAAFRTQHRALHIWRAVIGAFAMLCGFYALSNMALADVTALGFTTPLFATVLAVIFLGEPIRWRRWSAIAIGFLGVLLMVRPGASAFEPVALVALASALLIAIAVILVKKVPSSDSQVAMLFYFCIAAMIVSAPLAFPVWQTPTPLQWLKFAAVGCIGIGAQYFLIRAFQIAEASYIAPFDYSRLLLAGLLGYFLFGEVPDEYSLAGALVIAASTFYIARREARLGRAAGSVGTTVE
ncbi:MAG: DMT family transporter, partial [Rhodovibrionaceae bacterium]